MINTSININESIPVVSAGTALYNAAYYAHNIAHNISKHRVKILYQM